MEFLRNVFSVNQSIIQFVYGLAFFVLGLAIALQSRHSSRLDLARSLIWLSAFGFIHSFYEWGDLFIPLQAEYLAPGIITSLHYLHLLLLAISLACLFEFGVALLEPLRHREWLHVTTAGLLAIWFFVVFFPLREWIPDFETWHNTGNALARYFIGLPGGLLAAYALRRHILERIVPLDVPDIVRALQAAGISLAIYALATGLLVPPVNFFPGNWLNSDTFSRLFVVTPPLLRSVIGLVMAVTTIRALEIFDVETSRQIEAIQQQRMLSDERERIGRELHDGAIQKVYTAGLLVRSAQKLTEPESPLEGRLATAVGVLDDAIGDLRQNLGELQASKTPIEPFDQALQNLARDPRFSSLVKVSLNLDLPGAQELDPERSSHVLAIVQEALANIIRHAHAHSIQIEARREADQLHLTIRDDGIGIPEQVVEGHGLRNMRDRASLLHGHLEVRSLARGTGIILNIPWRVES